MVTPEVPTARTVRELHRRLGAWYAANRRDLPWRRTRDPYAIWISEAMLQQTRVETVLPYYARFLERLPTIEHLARASEDDVVALWSGLGYYRRARALRQAAQAVVERHGGRFPSERALALDLPGVGPYTAGAVLSIAYERPEPLVDGNVARVFARWFDLDDPLGTGTLKRELDRLAARLVPTARRPDPGPGTWNQALMELGALVCTPRDPACDSCPVAGLCRARRAGTVEQRPVAAARTVPIDVELDVLLAVDGRGRVLLERRPAGGRMARMWELPTRERPPVQGLPVTRGETGAAPDRHLWPADWRLPAAKPGKRIDRVRHGITRHRILAEVFEGELPAVTAGAGDLELELVLPARATELALTGMTRKILARSSVRALLSSRVSAGPST